MRLSGFFCACLVVVIAAGLAGQIHSTNASFLAQSAGQTVAVIRANGAGFKIGDLEVVSGRTIDATDSPSALLISSVVVFVGI